MKLRTKLMIYTAAVGLSASVAFAAIDGNALADSYLAEGYDFVEVKVGPSQTKVEAIKGTAKVEVIYDSWTGSILKQEQETADEEDVGRAGKQVRSVSSDFEDEDDDIDDDLDDDDDDDDADDDNDSDDDSDDDSDHYSDDDHDSDHDSGDDHGGDSDRGGDDD